MVSKITDYYDQLYNQRKSQAMRPIEAYRPFLNFFEPIEKNKRLLDIACGTGFFLKLAAESDLETYGIDISSEAVKIAQSNSQDSVVKVASVEQIPFEDNFFDYVSCLGSIEHFGNLNKALAEMLRVATLEAKFLFVVPNKNYFFWKLRKMKGTRQRDIGEKLKTLEEWKEIFSKAGLIIIRIKRDKYPTKSLPWFYSFNLYKIFKRLVFKIIWLSLPLRLTYQFIILAKKSS